MVQNHSNFYGYLNLMNNLLDIYKIYIQLYIKASTVQILQDRCIQLATIGIHLSSLIRTHSTVTSYQQTKLSGETFSEQGSLASPPQAAVSFLDALRWNQKCENLAKAIWPVNCILYTTLNSTHMSFPTTDFLLLS